MKKIIRACTVSQSLVFVKKMLPELMREYEVVLLSSPGEELDEAKAQYGIKTIAVPMERHISVLKDFVSLCRLIIIFLRERPDMVHSMTPKAGMLCMLAGWLTWVPVRVHTFTGLVFPTSTGMKRRILMFTDWLTCACATHVIPEGEGVKADLLNNGITKKPLQVLGYGNVMGVDLSYYSRLRVSGERLRVKDEFIFLFVGRIVRDKGINELVKAFLRLHNHHPNTKLYLVGAFEDSLDPISTETRQAISQNDSIDAVGAKRGDDLLAYYAAADCFVFPSYREGFPNTVLEAGAMDLPSIVTDINGSREIIIEGKNGVIVPPRDEQALYEAMKEMLENTEKRKDMAANARPLIAQRFEASFVRACLYDFYRRVV